MRSLIVSRRKGRREDDVKLRDESDENEEGEEGDQGRLKTGREEVATF